MTEPWPSIHTAPSVLRGGEGLNDRARGDPLEEMSHTLQPCDPQMDRNGEDGPWGRHRPLLPSGSTPQASDSSAICTDSSHPLPLNEVCLQSLICAAYL